MSRIFFTSDHHFGEKEIIEKCNRPFSSIEEMDEIMIQKWNEKVSMEDVVYYLGDFTLGNKDSFDKYHGQLNGTKYFIKGNHDNRWWKDYGRTEVQDRRLGNMVTVEVPLNNAKMLITLCHFPMRSWDKSHYGTWHLFGHHHGKAAPQGRSFDVGVDTNNFYPYSLEDVAEKMMYLVPTDNL